MINFLSKSEDGSEFYRIRLPCAALVAAGFDARIVKAGGEIPDADTWVISRPHTQHWVDVVTGLVELGKTVIVDIDDRYDCLRPGHVQYGELADRVHQHITEACRAATAVTGSTHGVVAAYGGTVIPNYIPQSYLDIQGRHIGPVKVGWAGTVISHPNDLQVTGGQVARVVKESPGVELAYVGPKPEEPGVREALRYNRRILTAGWLTFDGYIRAVAEFDIGIVPLEPCTFNDAKSWLKLLEFSAAGVPTVASPTEPNSELLNLGCGLAARYPNDWRRHVAALVASSEYRADVAGRSREIAAGLTIERNVERWIDVLQAPTRQVGTRRSVLEVA